MTVCPDCGAPTRTRVTLDGATHEACTACPWLKITAKEE